MFGGDLSNAHLKAQWALVQGADTLAKFLLLVAYGKPNQQINATFSNALYLV